MYWVRKYFTDPNSHFWAILEVIVTTAFALLPLLTSFFVEAARRADGSIPDLADALSKGQLYLLAVGVYGTVFWLAFLRNDKPRHDARVLIGALASLATFPLIGFIGVDPSFSTVLSPVVVKASYFLYGALLISHYLLLFFVNIEPPPPKEVFSREADQIRRDYEEFKANG